MRINHGVTLKEDQLAALHLTKPKAKIKDRDSNRVVHCFAAFIVHGIALKQVYKITAHKYAFLKDLGEI